MKISIIVTLKKAVFDPQGKVIKETLKNMNLKGIDEVRQGKYFEIEIDEKKYEKAKTNTIPVGINYNFTSFV